VFRAGYLPGSSSLVMALRYRGLLQSFNFFSLTIPTIRRHAIFVLHFLVKVRVHYSVVLFDATLGLPFVEAAVYRTEYVLWALSAAYAVPRASLSHHTSFPRSFLVAAGWLLLFGSESPSRVFANPWQPPHKWLHSAQLPVSILKQFKRQLRRHSGCPSNEN
jgi:hypothetical protein